MAETQIQRQIQENDRKMKNDEWKITFDLSWNIIKLSVQGKTLNLNFKSNFHLEVLSYKSVEKLMIFIHTFAFVDRNLFCKKSLA